MPPSGAVDQSHTSAALALAAESSLTAGQVATTSVETDTAPKSKAVTIARMTLKTIFPPLSWLPVYEPSQQLLRDLAGGLVMGVMHVPMSLGYASLLNIPLQVGLWSAVIYSGIYAFFGNTGVLSMGPVAEISLMLLSTPGLSDDPAQRAAAIQTVSFEVGVLSLGLCLIMGGTLIRNSFARAVGNAYAAAAGIIVIPSQMKDALNIKGSSTVLLQDSIQVIINGLSNTNWTNTIICFCIFLLEIGYLSSIKRVKFLPVWIPHPLIVVVVSILVTWLARLDERINLHIVKDVNGDWPTAAAPDLSQFSNTIVTGVVVTLVSFLQMYSVATRFSDDVNANQELFANGMCGFLCGFLGGMPGSTSFSRTAVLVDMKSKSPLNSIVAAIVVLASAAGLTRLGVFYYLPKVTLAAVTVAGVTKLIDFTHAVWLFKHFKLDFLVWLVVFFMTMFMGVAYGILCGIGLSIVIVLFRVGLPSSSTLAYDPAMDRWVDVTQDDELLLHREVHVWSFNSPLYFVNVSYFAPELEESLRLEKRRIRVVVVNCVSITSIDASSVESFVFQVKNMSERKGLTVVFCALPKAVKEALQQCPGTGFEFQCFNTINEAVSFADRHVMKEKQLLAPHHPVPAAVFRGEGNAATSTDSTVAIVAVVSSADRSPKQKIKLPIRRTPLQRILDENGGAAAKIKMGSVTYVSIQQALRQWSRNDPVRRKEALALASVMDEQRDDLKIVVKKNDSGDLNLIAKWGGVITPIGLQQAEACGEALASRLGFHHLRHVVQQDTAIDESRGLTALVTDLWKNRHAPPAAKTVPVVSAVTNGEDRALHTGRALVDAFVRAAKGGALSTQQDSVELVPDKALDEVSKECAAFNDRSDALVENALHARNAKETGLVMHLPGVRRVVESVEPMVNDVAHAAPIVALQQVVQLTMSLVRAVRDASQIPLPDAMVLGPVADLLQNGNPLDASGASSGEDMEGGELTDVDQPARAPNGGLQRVLSGGSLKRHSSDGGLRSVGSGSNFASGAFEPTPNIRFADGESPADFIRRYTIVIAKLLRRAEQGGDVNGAVSGTDEDDEYSAQDSDLQLLMQGVDSTRFDVSKITALYDNATYDVIHNATQLETLCNFDLRPLVSLLQPLYVAVTSGRFGVTSSERLIGGALQSVPLLRRLRQNFEERVNAPSPVPDASEAAASGRGGDVLRERMVPVNMIFTSASLITALRNCMAFSTAMRKASNPGAQAALLQEETGWHYMAHVVFNLTTSSDVAEAKPSSEQASTSSPTDQVSPLVPRRPFDGYVLDIFLSTGASLASDAAMELITEQERHGDVPVSPASPAFSTEGPSQFTSPPRDSSATPVVVSGTTVGASNPLAASGAASQAGKKTQLAARQLTRVSPMLRVWRLPLAHFFDVVDEMERVARTWSLGSS